MKFTLTHDDGTVEDLMDKVTVDKMVADAVAAVTPAVDPEVTELDVMLSDGTTKKFVPAA